MVEKKETKSRKRVNKIKEVKGSKTGQKDKAKKAVQKKSPSKKEKKVAEKKGEHREVIPKREIKKEIQTEEPISKTEIKEGKSVRVEEKQPIQTVREIPIEKIKFHGRKSLSNEERKRISFIISKKKKKPKFAREEMYKVKKLKDVWRRRRGIDSKAAEEKRGKGKIPEIGYKKPNLLTGIDPSGYYSVLVHNSNELRALNPGRDAIIIASAVGRRKRNEIIRAANDLKVTILNPRTGEI